MDTLTELDAKVSARKRRGVVMLVDLGISVVLSMAVLAKYGVVPAIAAMIATTTVFHVLCKRLDLN